MGIKFLSSESVWAIWLQTELGQVESLVQTPPKRFPCYGYMVLDSWVFHSQHPEYLYLEHLENMALQIVAAAQHRSD